MKTKTNLLAILSMSALVSSPVAFAGSGEGEQACSIEPAVGVDPCFVPEIVICPPYLPEVTVEIPGIITDPIHEEVKDSGDIEIKGEDDAQTMVDTDVDPKVEKDGGEFVDSKDQETATAVKVALGEPGGAEVQRGDGNVMYMSFSGAPSEPAARADGAVLNSNLGRDEKGSAIQINGKSVGSAIQREIKAPKAMIKEGRVFLR